MKNENSNSNDMIDNELGSLPVEKNADVENSVVLFQDDALDNDEGENELDSKAGKSFRSKELSEDDLLQPEVLPSLEAQWIDEHDSENSEQWAKYTIVGGVLIVLLVAIWSFFGVKENSKTSSDGVVVKSGIEFEDVKLSYYEQQAKLLDIGRKYLGAESIEEKVKYVRNPDSTEEKMRSYYGGENKIESFSVDRIINTDEPFIVDRKMFAVEFEILKKGSENEGQVNMRKSLLFEKVSGNEFLVDWETEAVYQPSDWVAFINEKSSQPNVFRVRVKRKLESGPYIFEFSDDEVYQAYQIHIKSRPDDYLMAFAKKDSPIDIKMKQVTLNEKLFDDQIPSAMILKVAFPENAQSDRAVEIIDIVSDNWFLP